MKDFSHKEIFTTKIDLPISKINRNIDDILVREIKRKNGNTCNENGYIFENSIQLLNRSTGELSAINNTSSISFIVKYSADIITPIIGEKYKCLVEETSKMGILAYIRDGEQYNNVDESPLLIIIPAPVLENQNLSINDFKKGDSLKIVVEAVRIKYHNKQIQVIAKIDEA